MKDQFISTEAAELTGVPYQTLVNWDKYNVLKPSVRASSGTGCLGRLYSQTDVLSILLIERLRKAGAPVRGVKGIQDLLADLLGDYRTIDDVHSGLYIVGYGKAVSLLTTRELQAESLTTGKQTQRYIADVIDAWRELKRNVREMDKDKAIAS